MSCQGCTVPHSNFEVVDVLEPRDSEHLGHSIPLFTVQSVIVSTVQYSYELPGCAPYLTIDFEVVHVLEPL